MTILRPEFFEQFAKPSVYVWRRGVEVLYVGASKQLLTRLGNHDVLNSIEPFGADDAVDVFSCDSIPAMLALENELIAKHQPRYNGYGVAAQRKSCQRCGKPFQRRPGKFQAYCSRACRAGRRAVSRSVN